MFCYRIFLASTAVMLLALAAAMWPAGRCHAAEGGTAAPATAGKDASLEQQKREALEWINQYLSRQVLLTDEYVKMVRTAVEKMSPEETQQWIKQTAAMRALLNTKEWKDTEDWLRGFLSVQTIYSQKEIEELRKKASQMSPGQLLDLMKQIREKHLTLQQSRPDATPRQGPSIEEQRAAFERQRKTKLKFRDDYVSEMNAQRKAAVQRSSSPLFGSGQGNIAAQYQGTVNAKLRSVRAPLTRRYGGYGGRW